MTSDLKLKNLNSIRKRLKTFQTQRKYLLGKDHEMPVENLLLKVNHQISFEFDRMLMDLKLVKKACHDAKKTESKASIVEK
jgi:hypothetical protein